MHYQTFINNFVEGLKNLQKNKQRSLLGLLGIVIGTASVIMLINIAGIIENQIMSQFKSLGTNVFTVSLEDSSKNEQGFDIDNLKKLYADNPDIEILIPLKTLNLYVNFTGKKPDQYYYAVASDYKLLNYLNIDIAQGRNLTSFDIHEPYVIAGYELMSKALLSLKNIVKIGNTGFTIIGFTKSSGTNMLLPFLPNQSVFISIENAKTLIKKFSIDTLLGFATSDEVIDQATQKLKKNIQEKYQQQRSTIRTAKTIIDQAKKQTNLLTILLTAIGSIALIVGGIGVVNVMLVSIAQRKKEIGLRIALGATLNDIKLLFLSEAITLCFIGGCLGTVLGLSVSTIFAIEMNMPFVISWVAIPAGILISVFSGLLSGVYPASQAAKMNPIDALKMD